MKDLDHPYFKVHKTITDNNCGLDFSVLEIRKNKSSLRGPTRTESERVSFSPRARPRL